VKGSLVELCPSHQTHVVSGSSDKTIHIWDATTGHMDNTQFIASSSDGKCAVLVHMQQTSMYCRIIQVFSIMPVMFSLYVEIHKVRTMRRRDGGRVGESSCVGNRAGFGKIVGMKEIRRNEEDPLSALARVGHDFLQVSAPRR